MDRVVTKQAKLALGAIVLAALAVPAFAVAPEAETALSAEQVAKGRQLFTDNGCSACHTLADASAAGSVGPSFDGNAGLDKDKVVNIVTNGQGAMPSFGWLGEEDIGLLADYIVHAKK
jgi:mono/diheme cytochrome c family protein